MSHDKGETYASYFMRKEMEIKLLILHCENQKFISIIDFFSKLTQLTKGSRLEQCVKTLKEPKQHFCLSSKI